MHRRLHNAVPALLAALATTVLAAAATHAQGAEVPRWTGQERVVAFGDVHGAYDELVALLKATGLVGEDLRWRGGTTVAVSMGDLLDRGPQSRRVMDLLMRLQGEAHEAGGRLHVILGNHEAMNLVGDLRYLAPEDHAAFAADETDAQREEAFAAFVASAGGAAAGQEGAAPAAPGPVVQPDEAALRAAFDQAYPRGFFARQAAFSPAGTYGRWLLSLPAVIVVNDTAYVHGGPSSLVSASGFGLNDSLRTGLARYLALRQQLVDAGVLPKWDMRRDRDVALAARDAATPELQAALAELIALDDAPELGATGPLWYRGSIYCKPMLEEAVLGAALSEFGVKRFVVGHTPTGDHRVRGLHGGRLVMLDTGMLGAYYRGRPAALVTEAGETWVQYAQPAERAAIDLSGSAQVHGRSEAALRRVLEQAPVSVTERGEEPAPWRVTLRDGDDDLAALFYPGGKGEGGGMELAAAALDDLLGTSLVPPTVRREIEGVGGALQLHYPRSITEGQRQERQLGVASWCPLQPQMDLMNSFDLLVANRGRSVDNILFAHQLSDLVLTDHRQAFGTERSLPGRLDRSKFQVPPALAVALRQLDETRLESTLGQWLDSRQIRALLSRRDELLGD